MVVFPDERLCPGKRLLGRVARQVPWESPVGHALAQDDSHAAVLVSLQARVRELGAARIDEAHRPVLEQLYDRRQGGVVLVYPLIAACRLNTCARRFSTSS